MIPMMSIVAWGNVVPWSEQRQVEQDLIISRALVALFSDPALRRQLRFRGNTALNKLDFPEPLRYSEEIDLVRTEAGSIAPVLDAVRAALEPLARARRLRPERGCAQAQVQGRCRRPGGGGADPPEGRDQHARDRSLRSAALHAFRGRKSLVLGRSRHPDLFAQGDSCDQAPRAPPEQQGPRSVRPRSRLADL